MQKKFRKNWIIYPQFQLRLILANLFVMVIVLASTYFAIRHTYQNLHSEGLNAHLAPDHPYFGFVNYQSNMIYSYLGIAFLVAFILSTLVSVFISHKVAGPIVRLRGYFKRIAEGNSVEKVAFRKGDFFSDLPEEINKAIERIKK